MGATWRAARAHSSHGLKSSRDRDMLTNVKMSENPKPASKKRRGGGGAAAADKRVKRGKTSYTLITGKTLDLNHDRSTQFFDIYETEVSTISDLLALDAFYMEGHVDKYKGSSIPFSTIHMITGPLRKLEAMIGLGDAKRQVLSIIVYFLQNFAKGTGDMLHTVVYGGPGVGKTKLIGILAEVYAGLGVLPTAKVTMAKRADLIAGYLGQTAVKTRKVIESAKGGVLLLDEAYALGDKEQRDSYSRECIDTLNQALSEEKNELICIIAGYKADLDERFFKSNPGLERRFPFRVSIGDYKATHLRDIFLQIVRENGWDIEDDAAAPVSLFEENKDNFRFNGGDMETLFTKTKFLHSLRVFGGAPDEKKKFTRCDIDAGLAVFLETCEEAIKARKDFKELISHIYM